MSIKIFCIYHKSSEIFKSEVIEPIQTGCEFSDLDLGILKDNSGDNIAKLNPYYGEMTAWYWVWKNYLKRNLQVEYIGFCHYRRFLNFSKKETRKQPFSYRISYKKFAKTLSKNYCEKNIMPHISNYDIILPQKNRFNKSIYAQYVDFHPKQEIDKLINIIKDNYPDYVYDMKKYLNGTTGYFCLNFLMKKECFEEFMSWVFDILKKLNDVSDWVEYSNYNSIRTPAYLIERFMNVWINHKIRVQGLKILERRSYMLCDSMIKIFGVKAKKLLFKVLSLLHGY